MKGCLAQGFAETFPIETLQAKTDENCNGSCGGGRFCGGQKPAVDTPDDDNGDDCDRPGVEKRFDLLASRCGDMVFGRRSRPDFHPHQNQDHIGKDADNAGQNSRDKQLADGLLGKNAIENQNQRRRDQRAEGAACRDGSGCEWFTVTELEHFGDGDPAHRGGASHTGSGNGGETGAADHRCNRETAGQAGEQNTDGVEQVRCKSRLMRHMTQHDKQRNHGEGVGLDKRKRIRSEKRLHGAHGACRIERPARRPGENEKHANDGNGAEREGNGYA